MKKIFTLLFSLLFIVWGKTFSQSCISLGCASAHTAITTDGSLPGITVNPGDPPGSCYNGLAYKQIYWEFFFSPAGGDFVQGFIESAGGTTLDIDYSVFDVGTTAPLITCPISTAGWTELDCNTNFVGGAATGPGQTTPGMGSPLTTTALHYYAIAIIIWQGVDNGGAASYQFDASAPTLDGNPLTVANCVAITLPVKLSSFSAKVNNCVVNLDWTSEIESGFKNYEVQYSTDGTSFKTIATLSPAENSGASQRYSYTDPNPARGNVFYRLKMSDIDGNFDYSKIVPAKLDCDKSPLSVYPNPVTDILNINNTGSQNENTTAKLFDNNGRLIYERKLLGGTNTINTHQLPNGIYLLQLNNGIEVKNIKIIK